MNKNKMILITCLSALFFGCDRQIPIPNIDSKPVLSINAFINDSLGISARLSTSESIQNFDTINPITDAIITIQNGDNSFKSDLISHENGFYTLDLPKTDKKMDFKITTSYEGYADIFATTTFYPKPSQFKIDTHAIQFSGAPMYEIKVQIEDIESTPNYYLFEANFHLTYKNGIKKSSKSYTFSNHPFVENKDIIVDNFELSRIFISDKFFDGQSAEIPFFAQDTNLILLQSNLVESCEMDIDITSVSKEVYQYFKALERLKNIGSSNFTTTIQIPSNIENGTGVFGTLMHYKKVFVLK